MAGVTSVGTILINEALPEELRKEQHVLDKKSIEKLFQTMVDKYPDKYKDVLNRLSQIGKTAVWTEGLSVSLARMVNNRHSEAVLAPIRQQIKNIINDDSLDSAQRRKAIIDTLLPMAGKVQDAVLKEEEEDESSFATQISSGARGKKADLNSLKGADLLTVDANDNFIPIPLLNSYSKGFTPAQYFAASYGQRRGMLTVKDSTAEAGYYNKRLVNAAHRAVVTREKPDPTRLPVGLPTRVDDKDNIGAVLALDAGKYKAGTILTDEMLEDLKDDGVDDILVHSTMTEMTPDGGVSQWAAGKRIRQGLHQIGDNVGVPAAQSIGEKLSQGSLCLAEGTLVRMADFSVKAIEAVRPGEMVLGADITGKTFPVKVLNTFDNGVRECTEYELRRRRLRKAGQSMLRIRCTRDHKVLAHSYYSSIDGEHHSVSIKPIGDLNKISGVVLEAGLSNDAHLIYDRRALLLGVLLGDGCYTESVHGVHLSCADQEQIDVLNEYLLSDGLFFKLLRGQSIYYRLSELGDRVALAAARIKRCPFTGRILHTVSTNPIQEWLTDIGSMHKYAHEKTIPGVCHSWNNKAIAELIAGLIVTDGSVYVTNTGVVSISFGSTSRQLATGVSELLRHRFGIYTSAIHSSDSGRKRTIYSFTITNYRDVKRFSEVIPLISRKRRLLNELLAIKPVGLEHAEWASLHSVSELGGLKTFDLEVDHPDHLFVLANGMIVSNSSKHSAGVADRMKRSGFEYLNRLVDAPDHFPEAGPLADEDGTVNGIEDAPQGGKYVTVNKKKYYLHPGINPVVKVGDRLEQGDDISDGIPHPAQLVKYRGVGEARRTFLNIFKQGLEESGAPAHRRNVETVVGGLLNWATVTNPDGIGDNVYGDIVPFNRLAYNYKPRPDAIENNVKSSIGKYLEEPVLHYTPGTRITKKVADDLNKWKIAKAYVHNDPPDFEPEHVRSIMGIYHDPDWRVRLSGFYTSSAFEKALHRGAESDTASTSYVPALTEGVPFGKNLKTLGKYGSSLHLPQ